MSLKGVQVTHDSLWNIWRDRSDDCMKGVKLMAYESLAFWEVDPSPKEKVHIQLGKA